MTFREERPGDAPAIRHIHETAFGRRDEADLVESLRDEGVVLCSLIAETDARPAGHVLFTRMWIDGPGIEAVALAPVAVLPEYQRRGIAAELIRDGLSRLRVLRERVVVVLGEPQYYSRFGFSAENARLIASPFPPEAFMALELESGALPGVEGRVCYARAFGL